MYIIVIHLCITILYTTTYQRLRPDNSPSPYIYGLPKVHKDGVPVRPIISTIKSPTYALARMLTRIIVPLAGDTPSYVQDSAHFVETLNIMTATSNTIMVSFDVTSLFTSVPVDEALQEKGWRRTTD